MVGPIVLGPVAQQCTSAEMHGGGSCLTHGSQEAERERERGQREGEEEGKVGRRWKEGPGS